MDDVQRGWIEQCIRLCQAVISLDDGIRDNLYTDRQQTQQAWLLAKYREVFAMLQAGAPMDDEYQAIADYLLDYANIHIGHWHGHDDKAFYQLIDAARTRRDKRLNNLARIRRASKQKKRS